MRSLNNYASRLQTKVPRPLGKRLLVKRHETETVTEGGIVLPDAAQNKPQMGMVLATGCDVTSLRKDDEILFQSLGLTETEIAGEKILIMDEEDVLIVFREEPAPDDPPPRNAQDPNFCDHPGCLICGDLL